MIKNDVKKVFLRGQGTGQFKLCKVYQVSVIQSQSGKKVQGVLNINKYTDTQILNLFLF